MPACFFASDLHGHAERYLQLFDAVARERPAAVFLGGDLLPSGSAWRALDLGQRDFVNDYLVVQLQKLRAMLGAAYPRVFVILGNDDPRREEAAILDAATQGVWEYLHDRCTSLGDYDVYGYAYVPPTPFLLKDWERYDVSRYVDPGSVSPEEGHRSVPVAAHEVRYATIHDDLQRLVGTRPLDRAVVLFHAPPYGTSLDRAALDGQTIEHVPLDVHVGSIAIRRFIEQRQPRITLHGHVHESARLTGAWSQQLGQSNCPAGRRTYCFSAAHDGPELALVRFDLDDPAAATRALL